MMLDIVLPDLPFAPGDEVVVLRLRTWGDAGHGAVHPVRRGRATSSPKPASGVHRSYVGNYFTSLEMMGATVTVMRLDDELQRCIDLEADSVGLRQFAG